MGASYPSSFLFLIGYFRHMKMIQQFTKIIFIYAFISLSDVIDPHQSLFTLIYPNLSFLPLHMLIYPWLSLYMLIYAYLSLSTFIYPFISLSTLIYTYLSLSYFIYACLFLSISIFPYLPISISYIYLFNKYVAATNSKRDWPVRTLAFINTTFWVTLLSDTARLFTKF